MLLGVPGACRDALLCRGCVVGVTLLAADQLLPFMMVLIFSISFTSLCVFSIWTAAATSTLSGSGVFSGLLIGVFFFSMFSAFSGVLLFTGVSIVFSGVLIFSGVFLGVISLLGVFTFSFIFGDVFSGVFVFQSDVTSTDSNVLCCW